LIALVAFVPMSGIEASTFPMFMSLRLMALIGGAVWVGSKLVFVFAPQALRGGSWLSRVSGDERHLAGSWVHEERSAVVAPPMLRPRLR
jgi:uncharacterized membrane protein